MESGSIKIGIILNRECQLTFSWVNISINKMGVFMKFSLQIRFFATFAVLISFLSACSHNPNKAEKIETQLERSQSVQDENVGVKEGQFVVQKKVEMAEELRRLQNEVYETEDRVYGNRKYGSKGLYGALKTCRSKLTAKENGGEGKLLWTEPMERVTDKEEEFKFGIDEKDKIVGVSEEFLSDRITRFKKYKQTLQKREDEYEEKLEICDTALKNRKSRKASNKAAFKESPKSELKDEGESEKQDSDEVE